jgi:hypothetical protein
MDSFEEANVPSDEEDLGLADWLPSLVLGESSEPMSSPDLSMLRESVTLISGGSSSTILMMSDPLVHPM